MTGARAGRLGWLSTLCVLASVPMVSTTARAAPASETDRAQRLYDEGRAHYEAGEYDAALERWGEAYGLVSDAPENDHSRYQLLYAIASAHDRAYAQDGDAAHLRKARDLLLKCQSSAGEVFSGDEAGLAAEQKRVRTLLDRVVDEMVEGRPGPAPEPEPEPEPAPEPEPPASEPAPAFVSPTPAPASAPAPQAADTPRSGKALFGTGLALIGVGTAGLGVMIAGMVMARRANDFSGLDPNDLGGRAAQIKRGRLGNGLSLGGGIAAGIMIPVGIALTVSGRHRVKDSAVAASVSPQFVGVRWGGRF